jgi:hypothetical protein
LGLLLAGGGWAGGQAGALPADLVGQAGGMQGDQLAAVAGADPAQDQVGVGPDLPGGGARPPAVTGRAEGVAGWVAARLADLGVAALFQPARRRIQAVVDRRFNRRKYNTAKTIQAYSTRLRDQVDLDTLSTELLAVVDQTTEPTRVSLWLRPSASGSSGTPHSEARPATWAY